ncbi:MAG: hypothetical protein ACHQUA_02280 [Microgenomates group bacterium]
MRNKMNTKRFLVSFVMLFSVLFLAAAVSAAPLATITNVEVDGLDVNSNPAITVGDIVDFRVEFSSLVQASDVTVEVDLEGDKKDVSAETRAFDVESGKANARNLKLDVPFDLKDSLSGSVDLTVTVSGDGFKSEQTYTLRVQRTPYSTDIVSVNVPQTVKAGETFPVDVVLKNIGYNDLDDLFVTATISALGVERTTFFGELVALECDDDDTPLENYGVDITRKCNEDNEDTVNGRLFLQVPYGAKSGVYSLQIEVENDDTTSSQTTPLAVKNAFSSGNFIVSGNQLLIVNPTNEVVVYRLIPESTGTISVSVSDSIVAVPAGSSKAVTVRASSYTDETQMFSVNVFNADGTLVDVVNFSAAAEEESKSSSPIVVLTIVLAIIFIILLVVLVVLIGKKPEKEEFGESYY